jgi:hypothetical protein
MQVFATSRWTTEVCILREDSVTASARGWMIHETYVRRKTVLKHLCYKVCKRHVFGGFLFGVRVLSALVRKQRGRGIRGLPLKDDRMAAEEAGSHSGLSSLLYEV